MKRLQFSLLSVFLLTSVVSVVILFTVRWMSAGAQSALEGILCCLWLISLILSYWKTTVRGWSRVFRVTAEVGGLWTAGVFGTHLMFIREMALNGHSAVALLTRATLVSLVGIVAALCAACVPLLAAKVFLWFSALTRPRAIITAAIVATVAGGIALAATVSKHEGLEPGWQPILVGADVAPSAKLPAVQEIESRHQVGVGTTDKGYVLTDIHSSPDGRFISVVNGPHLLVFDAHTTEEVARFQPAPRGIRAMFVSTTFLSDSSAIMAVTYDENGQTDIVGWDTSDWKARDDARLKAVYDREDPAKPFPILADHKLLLLSTNAVERDRESVLQIEVAVWDPLGTKEAPHVVVSLHLNRRIDESRLFDVVFRWKVSSGGGCIISPPFVVAQPRMLYRRGANEPTELPRSLRIHLYGVLSFLSEGELLVFSEGRGCYVWKSSNAAGSDRPPFWDHWKRGAGDWRIVVMDCMTGERVLQSDWFRCACPYLGSSRSCVAAKYGDGCLVWRIPPAFGAAYE